LDVLVVVGVWQTGQSTLAGVPESEPSGVTRSPLGLAAAAAGAVGYEEGVYEGGTSVLDIVLKMAVCSMICW